MASGLQQRSVDTAQSGGVVNVVVVVVHVQVWPRAARALQQRSVETTWSAGLTSGLTSVPVAMVTLPGQMGCAVRPVAMVMLSVW